MIGAPPGSEGFPDCVVRWRVTEIPLVGPFATPREPAAADKG